MNSFNKISLFLFFPFGKVSASDKPVREWDLGKKADLHRSREPDRSERENERNRSRENIRDNAREKERDRSDKRRRSASNSPSKFLIKRFRMYNF